MRFAINRREKTATGYKIGLNPSGPTDPAVPVLRLSDARGKPLAVVFGYACHNTTLTAQIMTISGDYAGFAQAALEAEHPGTVALFITGCAADANPNPRGTVAETRSTVRNTGSFLRRAVRAIPSAPPRKAP